MKHQVDFVQSEKRLRQYAKPSKAKVRNIRAERTLKKEDELFTIKLYDNGIVVSNEKLQFDYLWRARDYFEVLFFLKKRNGWREIV